MMNLAVDKYSKDEENEVTERRLSKLEKEVEELQENVHALAAKFDEINQEENQDGGDDRSIWERIWFKKKVSSNDSESSENDGTSDGVPDYLK
jgi:predicted RNase H-like nuclease (RuvC/YqgF family)